MKLSFLMVIAVVLSTSFVPVAQAQNAGLPAEKSTIAGTVVDALSEQPLKGAEVRLRGTPGALGSLSQSASPPKSATTDASGKFVFEGVAAGRYLLLASHDGYVNNNRGDASLQGKWLPVAPGQHVSDVVLRLLPGGSISGHITNEAGKPLRGVAVEAMKFFYQHHGLRELHDIARTTTSEGSIRTPSRI